MTKKKVFKLFANCIPVKGHVRFTICDLQRGDIYFINEGLFELLAEDKTIDILWIQKEYTEEVSVLIQKNIQFLIENELGFFCDNPEAFPDITRKWEYPGVITNAILEYSNASNYSFLSALDQLESLGCQFLEIRFYCEFSLEELPNFFKIFDERRLRNVDVLLPYFPQYAAVDFITLLLSNQRIGKITIHSAPKTFTIPDEIKSRVYVVENSIDNTHCGNVSSRYFTPSINMFLESLEHNSCLNRKVSIDILGNIKNCPSMKKIYGNIREMTIIQALDHSDFKQYWNISKDKIHVCKDCEFRYVCTDCRAYIEDPKDLYSKPLKCGYNPYTGEWSDWATNPLKEKAIEYYF